jgi:predicted Zn finger-like uncharacterized protein
MILTCPNCGTQYVVKDDAIPPEGRQVRCAACKHSWHQDPQVAAAADETSLELEPAAETVPAPESEAVGEMEKPVEESFAEATNIEPRSGPEAEERAFEESVIESGTDIPAEAAPAEAEAAETQSVETVELKSATAAPAAEDWNEPPHAEPAPDMFSPFAENGEVEPRRRGPLISILIVALIVIVAAAAFWFFAPPDLEAKLGLSAAGASPLALVTTHMDLQQLESGNQLLTVTGRVINPTTKEQVVPPLQAQLLGRGGKVVYSWTIDPPARTLPAGASASFNSAEVNVPPGGSDLRITLGQPRA